jgi:hypothetical protein
MADFTTSRDVHHSQMFSRLVRFAVKTVIRRSKITAFALMLALLVTPAVALSACRASAANAHDCCPAAASTHPSDSVQTSPARSCCELTSGKPAPVTSQAPANASAAVLRPVQAVATLAPVFVDARRRSEASPPLPVPSSQAVLCTFLI